MESVPQQQQKPVLGYWKLRGLGASIRYMLIALGVEFEMKTYEGGDGPEFSREPWLKHKFDLGLPFPNLPYFMDGEVMLTETLAILEYVAEKYRPEWRGSNPQERAKCAELAGSVKSLKDAITGPQYSGEREKIEQAITDKLPALEKYMQENRQFVLTNDHPLYIDFFFWETLNSIVWLNKSALDSHPIMKRYHSEFYLNQELLKQYMEGPDCQEIRQPFNGKRAKMNTSFKLSYFTGYGRGEPIRMLLSHAGVPFENYKITQAEWPDLKPNTPNGTLPVLEYDGQKFGQTVAILRFIGGKFGYYPEDPEKAFQCDELCDIFNNDLVPKLYGPIFTKDEEAKQAKIKDLMENVLPQFLNRIKPLLATGKWLLGDHIQIADFMIGGIYANIIAKPHFGYMEGEWGKAFETNHQDFIEYGKRFVQENDAWISQRNDSPF